MAKIFITLVSEQTIPNLQYIKEFPTFDQYIFISTVKMEDKAKSLNIINASQLSKEICEIKVVSEENYIDIRNTLAKLSIDYMDEISVNCTLGTKVMSIALFDFFRSYPNAKIYYTPIGSNRFKTIISDEINEIFTYNVTIQEYLACYGIRIISSSTPLYDFNSSKIFKSYFEKLNSFQFQIIDRLRIYRDTGLKNINFIEGLDQFLNESGIEFISDGKLTKYEVRYITGGWFEEWTYYQIMNLFSLGEGQLALGVNVEAMAHNDLDVVFIKNNDLYVIECKTSLGREFMQGTLYKSGALIEKFGRGAKTFLITLQKLKDKNGNLSAPVKLRSKQQNVTVYDHHDLLDFKSLKF